MFFWNKKSDPELLSLHIPKTAGVSFKYILQSVYGKKSVARFDIKRAGVEVNSKAYHSNQLPNVQVLHGHFIYEDLISTFEIPKDIKKVTWLRHPVKRVISNYYYLESHLNKLIGKKNERQNLLKRMQKTLLEFSRIESNRNRQSKFLKSIELDEFDFVGITENFEKDLGKLAEILNWHTIPKTVHRNKTKSGEKPDNFDLEVLQEIAELNRMDMDLYEKVLELRKISSQNA